MDKVVIGNAETDEYKQPIIGPDEFDLLRDLIHSQVNESAISALREVRAMAEAAISCYAPQEDKIVTGNWPIVVEYVTGPSIYERPLHSEDEE